MFQNPDVSYLATIRINERLVPCFWDLRFQKFGHLRPPGRSEKPIGAGRRAPAENSLTGKPGEGIIKRL